jgi:hypothetical protein
MVEYKLPFVNDGKTFSVPKLTFGVIYEMNRVDMEELPEGVANMEKALVMVTGVLHTVDDNVTKEMVKDKLDVDEMPRIINAIMEANKDMFKDTDFQRMNSIVKKGQVEETTT